MTKQAEELLKEVRKRGVVTIYASSIIHAAELIEAGLVQARDGEDGPWICEKVKGS